MHLILALHKWPKTSETIFFLHCLTSFEPTTLHQMVWTSLATNFTSSVRISQLLFKKFLLYILCNEIVKCGYFKRTLETVCQTFGKKHCKGANTWCNIARNIAHNIFFSQRGCMVATFCATIHTMPSWTLKFTSHYSTKCCRWCVNKEICCMQCCRSRTKFYCCNNAHYCSQNCRVDTQCNLAIVRNCIMYQRFN